jgi:hypothetical protein
VQTLQDPSTRRAAFAKVEATGIPSKARQAMASGKKTFADPKTRKRAFKFAKQTRRQSQEFIENLPQLIQKPKAKRFWVI